MTRHVARLEAFLPVDIAMLTPRRAPVRPRVFTPESGEALPLEEEILPLLRPRARGAIEIVGPPGSGKTTALRHLDAVLPQEPPILLLDEPTYPDVDREEGYNQLVIYTAAAPHLRVRRARYRLAPWTDDELIEYLLATHRERCASVLTRVRNTECGLFRGIPELWKIVLEELAADPVLPDGRAALHGYLERHMPDTDVVERARSACLTVLAAGLEEEPRPIERLREAGFVKELVRVLRHPEVQFLLAAERVTADLRGDADCDYLARRLPRELIQAAASHFAGDGRSLERLHGLLAGPTWSHAMAASLLHAADPDWVPDADCLPLLAGAYLRNATWAGAQLGRARLWEADLSQADLCGACLDGANLSRAVLRHARLSSAALNALRSSGADLTGANLNAVCGRRACFDGAILKGASLEDASLIVSLFREADLTGAIFVGADLANANFTSAQVRGADFSGANLRGAELNGLGLQQTRLAGACLAEANLGGCDLEGVHLPGADLQNALLNGALLTGAELAGADLTGACLRETGLGDINLEGADLRLADLRGATFHMGSSRCGLLVTPIASEGTRTGFYTDESEEQHFKSPEEIRKANLCGANLRGARVEDVDFYLVDLRGATYDAEQGRHFRSCRAILEARG
jgi:uncharacterized protein YjbI with pentapeptide repeats